MRNASPFSWRELANGWRQFFFAPRDSRICDAIRIGYSLLLLVNVLVLWLDLDLWFTAAGLVPYPVSREIVDPDTLTLFAWLPDTPAVVRLCAVLFTVHIVLLLLGAFSRVQAICVFVWLVSFQHRNIILFDGEDTVFRMLGFFLIFTPLGRHWSLDRRWHRPKREDHAPGPAWALRLIQLQMTLIYVSTAWEKASGKDWLDGTALYYVSRLDDLFGKFPVPSSLFESLFACKVMSWSVLAIEFGLPVALWFRETRRLALVTAIFFHLATDYAMNLFLFHWIMLVGLLSFVEPDDWRDTKAWFSRRTGDARKLLLRRQDKDDRIAAARRIEDQSE